MHLIGRVPSRKFVGKDSAAGSNFEIMWPIRNGSLHASVTCPISGGAKSIKPHDNGSRTSIIACDVRYLAFFPSRNDNAAFNLRFRHHMSIAHPGISVGRSCNSIFSHPFMTRADDPDVQQGDFFPHTAFQNPWAN